MNTEDLEKSLRAEFEGQMNNALTKLRADVADLQKNFESEFERHRLQTDESFRALLEKLDAPLEFDHAFDESVLEHLRLARDEGAEITATAMGEAEKLGDGPARRDVENLRNAINEIKANLTQASILRALVDAAGNFAPRGAFFIAKNDHLVGWKVFGNAEFVEEDAVRGIHFPVSSETILSDAVTSLANVEGSYADRSENAKFLGPLSFGAPNKMYAIPLGARGRGVAVLYADGGEDNSAVNIEALETLVSVAGLRIELLAAASVEPVSETKAEQRTDEVTSEEKREETDLAAEESSESRESAVDENVEEQQVYEVSEPESVVNENVEEQQVYEVNEPESVVNENVEKQQVYEVSEPESGFGESVEQEQVDETGEPEAEVTAADEAISHEVEYLGEVEVAPAEAEAVSQFEVERTEVEEPFVEQVEVEQLTANDYAFSSNNFSEEVPTVEAETYEEPVHVEPEPVAEMLDDPQPAKSYRERTVDLPIEVSDDERRPHSDARRFARLLISEIRLYNEQKVVEGRESGEIYELLRDAIDRSREMYEKRVQPDVAEKFDYFHYELVNNLAEGDEEKLGAGYFAAKA